jgi:hypothetical protein
VIKYNSFDYAPTDYKVEFVWGTIL